MASNPELALSPNNRISSSSKETKNFDKPGSPCLPDRSRREFTAQEVSDEIIHQLLNAASTAPNALNKQKVFYTFIKDKQIIGKISQAGLKSVKMMASMIKNPIIGAMMSLFAKSISSEFTLVGTSYYNLASPLIRYDTEDGISSAQVENSILSSFRIENGRQGQFIVDRLGKNIPLTGFIFGRHHKLFDFCSHVQVHQSEPGEATVLFVSLETIGRLNPAQFFDSSNVDLRLRFHELTKPIKSSSGKINLLVTNDDLQRSGIRLA